MIELQKNFKSTFISYQIQESTFIPPSKPKNCLMIATGSGVAPFLGVIEERQNCSSTFWRDLKLIFGIRNKAVDFLA